MGKISYDPSQISYKAQGVKGVKVDVAAAERAGLASGAVTTAIYEGLGKLSQIGMKGAEMRDQENLEADLMSFKTQAKKWDVLAEAELKSLPRNSDYETESKAIIEKYAGLAEDWVNPNNVRRLGSSKVSRAFNDYKTNWTTGIKASGEAFGIAFNRQRSIDTRAETASSYISDPDNYDTKAYVEALNAQYEAGDITGVQYNSSKESGLRIINTHYDKRDIAAAESAFNNNNLSEFNRLKKQVIARNNSIPEEIELSFSKIPDRLERVNISESILLASDDEVELQAIAEGLDSNPNLNLYSKSNLQKDITRKLVSISNKQTANRNAAVKAAESGELDLNEFYRLAATTGGKGYGYDTGTEEGVAQMEANASALFKLNEDAALRSEIKSSPTYKKVRQGLLTILSNPGLKEDGSDDDSKILTKEKIYNAYEELSPEAQALLSPLLVEAQKSTQRARVGEVIDTDSWWMPDWFDSRDGVSSFKNNDVELNQEAVDSAQRLVDVWSEKYFTTDVLGNSIVADDPLTKKPYVLDGIVGKLHRAFELYEDELNAVGPNFSSEDIQSALTSVGASMSLADDMLNELLGIQ